MNFIEQLFGTAPDGGTGAFEIMLFLIPIAAVFAGRMMKIGKPEARWFLISRSPRRH